MVTGEGVFNAEWESAVPGGVPGRRWFAWSGRVGRLVS